MIHRRTIGAALLALGACATPGTNSYGRNTCEPPPSLSPDGECSAYSKQGWSDDPEDGIWTQVFIACKVDGSFRGHLRASSYENPEHGVSLRWLANDRVEIATPKGAAPSQEDELHWLSDGRIDSGSVPGLSLLRIVHVAYRDLTTKDREWNHSCYTTRPKPTQR